MQKNELHIFMKQLEAGLASEYQRIRSRALEDPGTAGDEGEENWAELLRSWLPSYYHIVTKGRILSHDGRASPQVDVLVLHPSYPKSLINKKHYLAGGVLAAFECKLTLKREHLKKAALNCHEVKSLVPRRMGTPYGELHQPIVYGLLAHSHRWKLSGREAAFSILNRIEACALDDVSLPWQILDIICVADTATFYLAKSIHIGPNLDSEARSNLKNDFGVSEGILGGYFCAGLTDHPFSGTVLGSFLCRLSERLAYEDPSFRAIAEYYPETGIDGGAIGRPGVWLPDVLSAEVLKALKATGTSDDPWSHWSLHF